MKKLCLIYNTAPHYREAIFRAIDNEYNCEWFLGYPKDGIKEMDTSLLKHVHYYKTYGNSKKFYWKRNILKLLFRKEFSTFFMLLESRCLTDYFFLVLACLLKKKVYIWTHGWYGKESKFEAYLKRWQFNNVEGLFVYSDYSRNLLIEQGIKADKIYTIHNSLNYDEQIAIRKNLTKTDIFTKHFNNNNSTIIFIGRLTKVKKLDMLIDAVSKLSNRGSCYNIVFVGEGVEKSNLENIVKERKLEDYVWFYGACYDEKKIAELLYNAEVCVSPGNVGLTAMHSLVFGCPIITHNCFRWQMPEFEAVRPGITGDFFEMNDADSLVNTISNWFANKATQREKVRVACFKEIDTKWNPYFQIGVIRKNIVI